MCRGEWGSCSGRSGECMGHGVRRSGGFVGVSISRDVVCKWGMCNEGCVMQMGGEV